MYVCVCMCCQATLSRRLFLHTPFPPNFLPVFPCSNLSLLLALCLESLSVYASRRVPPFHAAVSCSRFTRSFCTSPVCTLCSRFPRPPCSVPFFPSPLPPPFPISLPPPLPRFAPVHASSRALVASSSLCKLAVPRTTPRFGDDAREWGAVVENTRRLGAPAGQGASAIRSIRPATAFESEIQAPDSPTSSPHHALRRTPLPPGAPARLRSASLPPRRSPRHLRSAAGAKKKAMRRPTRRFDISAFW